MIYVGEIYKARGRVEKPIFGTKDFVTRKLQEEDLRVKLEYDESESTLVINNIFAYALKKIVTSLKRLFAVHEWKVYLQNAKQRKAARARRRERILEARRRNRMNLFD